MRTSSASSSSFN